jgi:flagellar protein FliS
MNSQQAVNSYKTIGTDSKFAIASSHRLVQLMFQGVKENINLVKLSMKKQDYSEKGRYMGKALGLIEYLKACLEPGIDGDFSETLAALYGYMEVRLTEANLENSEEKFDEVVGLVSQLEEGWNGIPEEYRA